MRTRLNRDVSDRIDDAAPVAPPPALMPTGTPPWMWLARESLPHLPLILRAVARILLALLLGGAALVLALRGQSLPAELLRAVSAVVHGTLF
jgi:hypothetical protein